MFTPRQDEVYICLQQGKTNKEISAELKITERTVKFHVAALYRKLGLRPYSLPRAFFYRPIPALTPLEDSEGVRGKFE
jgi:DNA-binding NarL/FixJ family response regulator